MQRYFSNKKVDNTFILGEDDIYHIKTVMRMQENDIIEVVYENDVYNCCLENVKKNLQISIKNKQEKLEKKIPFVTLIIPVLKENKMDLILQKATEMGVSKIIIMPLNRCVVRLKPEKINQKKNRWERIIKEASEQSKRVDIPQIECYEKIENLKNIEGINLICSTSEREKNLKRVLTKNKNCDRINLVIGPEGGLTAEEESSLENINFSKITLGNQILRVETVPLFLMSVINYEFME